MDNPLNKKREGKNLKLARNNEAKRENESPF
jgi:hypothetical protein